MEITLCIRGQKLEAHYQPLYSGSIGVLYARFAEVDFDKTLIKTVRFKTSDSDWYTSNIIDGAALVPHEVIVDGGFDIALAGYDSEDGELTRFLPTNSVHIDVTENGFGEPDAPLKTEGNFESVISRLDIMAEKGVLSEGDNVFDDLPTGIYHVDKGVINAPVEWCGTLIVSRGEPDENNMVYSERIFITGDAEYNAEIEEVGFIYQATLYGTVGEELGADTPWYDVTRKSEINAELKKKSDLSFVEKIIPKATVEGEIIDITDHLADVDAINYKIYGNSTQETRIGKNIFDIDSFVESAKSQAIPGYEITYEELDGKEAVKVWGRSAQDIKYAVKFKANTQYSMSFDYYDVFYNNACGIAIRAKYDDGTAEYIFNFRVSGAEEWKRLEWTSAADKTLTSLTYTYSSGAAYTYISNWQIEEGSTVTDYEPYGAMPSKEFPSEIQSVGNLVIDKANKHYGRYVIPIEVKDENDGVVNRVNIYLDEPLRETADAADYIDFAGMQVVRKVEVLDDSGTLPIDQSYSARLEPLIEKSTLDAIILPEGEKLQITVETDVSSSIELTYYQDINKKLSELQSMIATA